MTENIDTYVLPQDSDSFLAEVLPLSDPLRSTWAVLSVEEKSGYLSAALQRMENLTYRGDKAVYWQPLKFPRVARGIPVDFKNAPKEVKRAQVVWAAEIVREELYVKRRNTDACIALGIITKPDFTDEQKRTEPPVKVKELLYRWITNWRKI